ncbi:DUF5723 family protein [Mesonia maritima]|uniref:DUF5723 domain-containing protein n=1 Tax=Mesonia maritima TaxID=1793873 RepID=A0ABU1K6F0_9FLAO|nr:DUF5723 family protein [Mesonia maritima]MDR6300582.1 hypothetical protein [Mesonia maritima]
MKKFLPYLLFFIPFCMFAQDHFLGINTSRKTSLLNADNNPAELTNLSNKVDISLIHISTLASNNKINMIDFLDSDKEFDDYKNDLLSENDPFSITINLQIIGPGVAYRIENWGFGIKTTVNAHISLTDIDPKLIDIIEEDIPQIDDLNTNDNQRITAIGYETIDFSVARNIFDHEIAKLSAGITFKLLFGEAYANGGIDKLNATIEKNENDDIILRDANARIDVAYAGLLGESFDDFNYNYLSSGVSGLGVDFGLNYLLKNEQKKYPYKLNLGLSIKNIGGLTFNKNAERQVYELNIPDTEDFDASQFEDVDNAEEVIKIIENSNYFSSSFTQNNVKVNLPTSLNIYADYQVHGNFFASFQMKQSLVKNSKNSVLPSYSSYAIIPRYSSKGFETYLPLSVSTISDFSAGLGFRFGGFFYLGSSSAISALASNQLKQIDLQLGFRIGIGSSS